MSDRSKASLQFGEVCSQLLKETPLFCVLYARFYSAHELEVLISDARVTDFYLTHQVYQAQFGSMSFDQLVTGYVDDRFNFMQGEGVSSVSEFKKEFGFGHPLSFQFKNKAAEFCDFVIYYPKHNDHEVNQFYLSNLLFLQQYSELLIPCARHIVTEYELPKITVTHRRLDTATLEHAVDMKTQQTKVLLNVFQYQVDSKAPHAQLKITAREFECLCMLLEKKTAKEAAKIIQISHRTIEHHYDRLKFKLKLNQKKKIQAVFEYD